MSDALAGISGVGSAGFDGSLTSRALQQALAESLAEPVPVPAQALAVNDADTSAVATGTGLGDPLPDSAPGAAALVARGQSPRRTAGADASDIATVTSAAADARAEQAPTGSPLTALPLATEATALPTVAMLVTSLQTSPSAAGSMAPGWRPMDDGPARSPSHQDNAADEHDTADEAPPEDGGTVATHGGAHGAAPVLDDELQTALRQLEALADAEPPWCAPLLAALRAHARRADAAPLLRVALTQWRSSRAVLIAAPQPGADASAGWLHALRYETTASGVRLNAQRFAARLSWQAPLAEQRWWGVRATKQQSLHIGHQLSAQADLPERPGLRAAPPRPPALGLRLGAAAPAAQEPSPAVLLVQVDAVARLWSAVELQWHVALLACSQPLYANPRATST